MTRDLTRRDVLRAVSSFGLAACSSPRSAADLGSHPEVQWGVQVGDVTANSAVIWSRADRVARLVVQIENGPEMAGEDATEASDFTARAVVRNLAPGTRVRYRARFDRSDWLEGSFTTAPVAARRLRFAWSGDTNGQGWGIDLARGGMPAYAALAHEAPDLFLHLGDTIYADNPIPPSLDLPDGTKWNNVVMAEKAHVAETLADYRAAQRYPRMSAEVRLASAHVPMAAIWDDHEVRNNWFPGEVLDDPRYARENRIDVLARHARRAFFEYQPTLLAPSQPMYRVLRYGPLADVFLLDGRAYRTPNDPPPPEGAMLGPAQEKWLIEGLRASRATWKIVASNMPVGLVIGEPARQVRWAADGWGNENNGAPTEREVELARILGGVRGVKNIVWLGADVHYAAAHRFDPVRAAYRDFDSFWELVAGPIHATTFGRKNLDLTFGPELEWCSVDWQTRGSPADGLQFIGVLEIDPGRPDLQVKWINARGEVLHRLTIPAL
jgi:alkaline phosphatase D